MSKPMTLVRDRQLELNAQIDELVTAGIAEAVFGASEDVVAECARRYVAAQIISRSRRGVRSREQSVKASEETKAIKASRIRAYVSGIAADLRDEWTAELLADNFVLPNGQMVSWGNATIAQHETRAEFLEGLASGNAETAAIHRRASSDCLDAHVECLVAIR
jgi:hypothetical protein